MHTQLRPITFAVHGVEPATKRLETHKTHQAVALLTGARPESCCDYTADCVANVPAHPLLYAAHLAWSHHYPLVLSPDTVWVAVLQGLAHHVRNNPEKLRGRFVGHEGRKTLRVLADIMPGSPENEWAKVADQLAALVAGQVGEHNAWLSAQFSTTGPAERTAAQVALLDAMQPYFEYRVYCVCGIPSVQLEGTPEDWDDLARRVVRLADYDMGWWLEHLRPITAQFCRAIRGDIDLDHWRNLYKKLDAYGDEIANGWLAKLVPYVKDYQTGNLTRRNEMLSGPCVPYPPAPAVPVLNRPSNRFAPDEPGLSMRQLPAGLASAHFTLEGVGCPGPLAMEFLGGFVGVTQDEQLALRPKLGWAVRRRSGLDQLLLRLEGRGLRPALSPPDFDTAMRALERKSHFWTLPGDFLSFYKAADGGELAGCRVRPLGQVDVASVPAPPDAEVRVVRYASDGDARLCRWLRFADLPDGSSLALPPEPEHLLVQEDDPNRAGRRQREVFPVIHCRPGEPDVRRGHRVVAWSLAEFLARMLDGGGSPYFLAADFQDRGDAFTAPRWAGPPEVGPGG